MADSTRSRRVGIFHTKGEEEGYESPRQVTGKKRTRADVVAEGKESPAPSPPLITKHRRLTSSSTPMSHPFVQDHKVPTLLPPSPTYTWAPRTTSNRTAPPVPTSPTHEWAAQVLTSIGGDDAATCMNKGEAPNIALPAYIPSPTGKPPLHSVPDHPPITFPTYPWLTRFPSYCMDRKSGFESTFLGNFKERSNLSSGTSSIVLKARVRATNLPVAIKVQKDHYDNFREERQLAQHLQSTASLSPALLRAVPHNMWAHPLAPHVAAAGMKYILPVLHYGVITPKEFKRGGGRTNPGFMSENPCQGPRQYLSTPLGVGTLLTVVEEVAKDPEIALRVCAQLAIGLAYSHLWGIQHNDIKAQNIIVAQDGTMQLADFGLSEFLPAVDLALHGRPIDVRGRETWRYTTWYRPPELLECTIHRRSRLIYGYETDVYALGCVMYHAITGFFLYSENFSSSDSSSKGSYWDSEEDNKSDGSEGDEVKSDGGDGSTSYDEAERQEIRPCKVQLAELKKTMWGVPLHSSANRLRYITDDALRSLVGSMVAKNPADRPTIMQVLTHPSLTPYVKKELA